MHCWFTKTNGRMWQMEIIGLNEKAGSSNSQTHFKLLLKRSVQCTDKVKSVLLLGTKNMCVSHSVVSNSLRLHRLYPTPPSSSVHGILQARILEWVAIPLLQWIFPTQGSNLGLLSIAGKFFTTWGTGKTPDIILNLTKSLFHLSHQGNQEMSY